MNESSVTSRTFRKSAVVVAVVGTMLVATTADGAVGVLTKKRAREAIPGGDRVGGKLFIGWTQAPRSHPSRLKVLVKRGSRKPIRLNRRSTKAYMGGIDGQVAVYQEVKNSANSNIWRYNLKTGNRTGVTVNSPRWEYHPTISGRFILFGRNSRFDTVVLFNKKTGGTRTLASMKKPSGNNPLVTPGQVNGDFAVFERCTRHTTSCDVVRYRISTRQYVTIPQRRPFQYAPSVSRNGTVYFAGSRRGCGADTAIYRRRNGNTTRIAKLGGKNEMFSNTHVIPRAGGGTDVFYSMGRCKNKKSFPPHGDFDILRVKG